MRCKENTMSNGLLAFIAGLGTGYVNQSRYNDEKERQAKLDQITFDKAADEKTERQKKIAGDQALASAGSTAVVEPSVTNDDDGNPTSAPPVRVVGAGQGQAYIDPAAAQTAAAAANAQPARARQIQALNGIDPERAQKMEAEQQAVDAKKMELQAGALKLGDAIWQHDRQAAKLQGWSGFEDLINRSEVGPMAGRKVKIVPSDDGKSVSVNIVNPDGTLTPTQLNFSNDAKGLDDADIALDRSVGPMQRVEFGMKAGKTDAEIKELIAKAGYWDANGQKQQVLAANGGAAPRRADHFDDKQWDAASKIDKDLVGIPDPAGGDKPTQSGDLRSQRMQLFNSLRTQGDLSPQEAAEKADTAVVNIKNIAMQRWTDAHAQDKKSTMTVDQAIKQVIKEASQRAAAAKPAAVAPGKVNPGEQAGRDADALAIVQQELQKSSARLAQVKTDPQATPDDLQRAQADVDGLNREVARLSKIARVGVNPAAPATAPKPAVVASAGVPPVAAPAAPTPMPTGPGPDLDTARAALESAKNVLLTYSPKKQAQDPQGFAAAKAALVQAQQRAAQAEAAWQGSVGTMPASTARPGLHL
jgi:hypothetical protein